MYLKYFGLTEHPFSIAPDPHYLYMSARHKEAMAHLTYGLSQGGCFIVLTGEVGTGKTTLCRNLLTDLPDNVDVSLILNANINEQELLQTICDELKIAHQVGDSQKQLLDKIYAHLMATFADNRHTVLIIDEAQLLSRDVLESIRLLTNLETTKSKLLQIILIGQPELNDLLSRNDLRQLAQRVTARYHLGPLERSEIDDYINFRLGVAGCKQPLFSRQALNKLHRMTDGIPRKINVLADHALLSAYSKTQSMVDSKNVKESAQEVFIEKESSGVAWFEKANRWWALAAAILLLNIGLWWWFAGGPEDRTSLQANATAEKTTPIIEQQTVTSADAVVVDSASGVANMAVVSNPELNEESSPSVAEVGSAGVNAGAELTTILRSSDITPGSVVISEEFLDDSLTQEVAAVAPPPVPVALNYNPDTEFGAVLETSADISGRIAAFRNLSTAWDVELPAALLKPVCRELEAQGVRCLDVKNWQQMRRFNRPTIMVLEQRTQLHRVILFSIEGGQAKVLVGENVHTVSVSELKSRWAGKAVTFWRPGAAGNEFLQQGTTSAALPDVRIHLNKALTQVDMPILFDVESREFDREVAQKAFALQTRFGIVADGKIGNETYLLMNELVYADATPVLQRRRP